MMSAPWLLPALTASVMALLATPWLARIGVWGIQRWVEHDVANRLRYVEPLWWVATAVLALAMGLSLPLEIEGSMPAEILAAALVGLSAALLIQLARIDAHCQLLPDPLTLGLLLSGLAFHAIFFPQHLNDSAIGALLGYAMLWSLALVFRWVRKVEAMGRGDFAMTAGIGAWLGWQALPLALVLACIFALSFALLKRVNKNFSSVAQPFLSQELAFGPALCAGAASAWIALG